MRNTNGRVRKAALIVVFLVSRGISRHAQNTPETMGVPDTSQNAGRSIEDLNLIGAETAMTPFVESPIDIDSGFRRTLFSEGVALRGLFQAQYAQNTLQAPVPANQQSYVGERPFEGAMTN